MNKEEELEGNVRLPEESMNFQDSKITIRTLMKPSQATRLSRNSSGFEADNVDKNDRGIRSIYRASIEENRKPARHISKNFIIKNIQDAPKTRKIEYDTDGDDAPSYGISSNRRTSGSSDRARKTWAIVPKMPIINYDISPQQIIETPEDDPEGIVAEKFISAQAR